jgi:hypothetical protein
MSSPSLPINGPLGSLTDMPPADSSTEGIVVFASELTADESTLALAVSRGGPPPEVRDRIATASRIESQLRESGQHVRFLAAGAGQPTEIAIHDREGNAVRTLTIAEAIALAAGEPLG